VIRSRILPQFAFARVAMLTMMVTCALGGPLVADPLPSPDYPPTYSSRKAPWYDPFSLFTSTDKKSVTPAHATSIQPDVVNALPGTISTPAWKWYGYGTPTPGQNPLAPNGNYPGVPGNWYGSSGTTPGAVPHGGHGLAAPGVVPDPVPSPILSGRPSFGTESSAPVVVPKGPELPNVATRTPIGPAADVNWQSSPARLRAPANESFATDDDRPRASLKAPVPVDESSVPVTTPAHPESSAPPPRIRRPGEQSDSPDLPVEPAPDIVPPMGGTVSKAITPVTARALAPDSEVPTTIMTAIRRACGTDVRVMEVARAGSKRLLVRMSGTPDGSLAARNRLAREPEIRGWRIEFELVTPLAC